jgi:hypothetical protein
MLRISEKHGVNPSLAACCVCGNYTGELLLLGRLPNDAEAPRRIVVSDTPCATCQEYMQQGVVLVEVQDGKPVPNLQPRRTGRIAVVTAEAFDRIFTPSSLRAHGWAFVSATVWAAVGLSDVPETPAGGGAQ